MDCPRCGTRTLDFPVPEVAREQLPDDRRGGSFCPHCLAVTPTDDPPADYPEFSNAISGFPDGETGAVVACVFALVDSLALYRGEVSALAAEAEHRGVDVLLLFDRVTGSADVDPYFDAARRSRQLEQLLYD